MLTQADLVPDLVAEAEKAVRDQGDVLNDLDQVASKHAYYRYNDVWTRRVQELVRPH
jgi:hypothetical protein